MKIFFNSLTSVISEFPTINFIIIFAKKDGTVRLYSFYSPVYWVRSNICIKKLQ